MSRPAEAVNAPGLDVERVRADFPILQREVHGKPLVYLDTAASAHRPLAVIEATDRFYRRHTGQWIPTGRFDNRPSLVIPAYWTLFLVYEDMPGWPLSSLGPVETGLQIPRLNTDPILS